jgi:hypothetical protein
VEGHFRMCPSGGSFQDVFEWRVISNLQLPMQSAPITTDVVSSNVDNGDAYNIM